LTDHIKTWIDNHQRVTDLSNESYYLPENKKQDSRIFCQGVDYVLRNGNNTTYYQQAWLTYCGGRRRVLQK
jgi:hypothetical protein